MGELVVINGIDYLKWTPKWTKGYRPTTTYIPWYDNIEVR